MFPVAIKTTRVINKETLDNEIGVVTFAATCLSGSTGIYLTICKAFPSLVIDWEAPLLITLAKSKIKQIFKPFTKSG